MQYDEGDTRFLLYALEHSFLWVSRAPHHLAFWDPPFYFPAPNAAAYSETMLSLAPFYWAWRLLGWGPDTAFQLWMLTLGALNFVACHLFLRRVLGSSSVGAACGAFLFSFAALRINQLGHEQLLAHFYSLAAVFCAWKVVAPPPERPKKRETGYVFAFFGFWVLQVYAGFYWGWFLALALGIATLLGLASKTSRGWLLSAVRRNAGATAGGLGLSAALLTPFYSHYSRASAQVGFRKFDEVLAMLPRPASFLDMGPFSWLYGRTSQWIVFRELPLEWEHRLGLGVFSALVVGAGLLLGWRRPLIRVSALTVALILLLAVYFPQGVTAWHLIYTWVPGGMALRTVSRVGIFLLFPAALAIATLVDHPGRGGRRWAVYGGVFLALSEQGLTTPSYDKAAVRARVHALAQSVASSCAAFIYLPPAGYLGADQSNLDAMLASLERGIPTLNGYSGNHPPGWELEEPHLYSPMVLKERATWVQRWQQLHPSPPMHPICWAAGGTP